MDLTDEALVENYKRTRNITMFQALVRRYQGRIFSASFRILSNAEEAEEVVQDTFLKVHQNIHNFRNNAVFSSWVFRITHNICMDILRHRSRRKGLRMLSFDPNASAERRSEDSVESFNIVSQLADPSPGPADSAALHEQHQIVSDSLKMLTDSQRTVVVLFDIEGFTYEEIADIIGTSIGTVRSRLHYGRLKLKEILEPYFSHQMPVSPR